MAEDCLLKIRLSADKVVQVGDTGKTVVRDLGDLTEVDQLEPNFFYCREYNETSGSTLALGEISNIRVEPKFTGDLNVGDAVVFGSSDLLD